MIISTKLMSHRTPEEKSKGCLIASRRTRNNAKAVQSLNRLSPSSIRRSLLGSHISFAIDNIATGSVDEITIQKSSMTWSGISIHIFCKSRCPHRAIIAVEISNQNVASDRIGR